MTTVDLAPRAVSAQRGQNRILRIVRLHLVNPWTTIGVPWLVLAFVFLANLAIWILTLSSLDSADRKDTLDGLSYSGASFYIFAYMLVVAVQAINRTFPFALGFGITRRDFYLGTSLTFALLSVAYGAAFTLLSYIEDWTHGWGFGGTMFTAAYFSHGAWYERLFVFVAAFLIFFFIGTACATVFVRWKTTGLLIAGAIVVVIVLGALAIIGLTQSWAAFGNWFLAAGSTGVVAWMLVPTAIAAVAGFFILRRATPKNG